MGKLSAKVKSAAGKAVAKTQSAGRKTEAKAKNGPPQGAPAKPTGPSDPDASRPHRRAARSTVRPHAAPGAAATRGSRLKVRIGLGLGTQTLAGDAERFPGFVDALEARGFDSLWLTERLTGPVPDPLIALAVAGAARQAQAGHQRAGRAGPQPGGAGQGAGQPRPAVGRPVAARALASGRRCRPSTGRSASTRARAGLFDEALS